MQFPAFLLRRGAAVATVLLAALPLGGSGAAEVGKAAGNFRLDDHTGRSHELRRYRDHEAVVLIAAGNGCPIWQKQLPNIHGLAAEYGPKGVAFLMINANSQDDAASIAEEAGEFHVQLPILVDETQLVARSLGMTRTCEAVVIDAETRAIVYRGGIDDRYDYGVSRREARHTWLRDALDAFLAGEPVPEAGAGALGCIITYRDDDDGHVPSYTRRIGPLVAAKCALCHRPGGSAPFSFESHDDLAGWGEMVAEVLMTRRMPPWGAAASKGPLKHDLSLTADEMRDIVRWVEAGAPRDEGDDPLAAVEPAPDHAWALGEPDVVVESTPRELPAEGVFDYEYVQVPSPVEGDVWVTAAEVAAANTRAVHHSLVFVMYPESLRHLQPEMRGGLEGYFAGYVPGAVVEPWPAGTAKFLPAGSVFVFQNHYNATGRPESVQPRLGLHITREAPESVLLTRAAANTDFVIPAGEGDHVVTAAHRVPKDARLWSLSAHMHYRGSWFEYVAEYPDGTRELLLSIPRYNFDWQHLYRFEEPVELPAGTRIRCRGGFDNSATNPFNPDASKDVRFGEQTWEEMFIGYMEYSVPYDAEEMAAR